VDRAFAFLFIKTVSPYPGTSLDIPPIERIKSLARRPTRTGAGNSPRSPFTGHMQRPAGSALSPWGPGTYNSNREAVGRLRSRRLFFARYRIFTPKLEEDHDREDSSVLDLRPSDRGRARAFPSRDSALCRARTEDRQVRRRVHRHRRAGTDLEGGQPQAQLRQRHHQQEAQPSKRSPGCATSTISRRNRRDLDRCGGRDDVVLSRRMRPPVRAGSARITRLARFTSPCNSRQDAVAERCTSAPSGRA
jgi:hypothetical protein